MRRCLYVSLIFTLSLILLIGCGKISHKATGEDVIAVVNGKAITKQEFDKRIKVLPEYYREIAKTRKKEFLNDMIDELLLYNQALKLGIHKNQEVIDMIEHAKRRIIVSKLIKHQIEAKAEVTEKEIEEYYNSNRDKYIIPEKWRASHILVDTEEVAKEVLDQLSAGASFEELARRYSKDPTSIRGGDIGLFTSGELVPEFEQEIKRLNVGQISGIVKTRFGYHIIKVTDHIQEKQQDLESVKEGIKNELLSKKRRQIYDEYLRRLRDSADIEVSQTFIAEQRDVAEEGVGGEGKEGLEGEVKAQ